ncbi:MAG TPA: hypothetical protein VJ063_20950 [Verrucomicrobiae bacterium]|nr:hypothetical protein [Verrucomicrobiae bacterium]
MTTFLQMVAREPRFANLSTDSAPITNEILVTMVMDVVGQANWAQPNVDGRLGRSKTARGEVLLATLTYCYAWGIYSSREIEGAILRNRKNADLLDCFPIDRKAFMQFRRHNRDLVKSCLTQVLGRLNTGRYATAMDLCDAEQRIARAAECDCIEAD